MFGQYAAFIIPSYIVTALVIVGLFVWIRLQYRTRLETIAKLEEGGMRRRSQSNPSA